MGIEGVVLDTAASIATIAGSVGGILTIVFVPLFRKGMKEWHEGLNETIDNRVTPHFVEVISEITQTKTEVQNIKNKIVNHESRISYLEGYKKGKEES